MTSPSMDRSAQRAKAERLLALHAGPVYEMTDPITGATNYFGAHVSRAARIEPITPPGHIYASQAFAALATAQAAMPDTASGPPPFTCVYVGQVPLAKRYGTFAMYHVRRTAPS